MPTAAARRARSCRARTRRETGEVQIKDLILGATLSSIKDRDEYLSKQAEVQFPCREDEMVAEVRKLLARNGVTWD